MHTFLIIPISSLLNSFLLLKRSSSHICSITPTVQRVFMSSLMEETKEEVIQQNILSDQDKFDYDDYHHRIESITIRRK